MNSIKSDTRFAMCELTVEDGQKYIIANPFTLGQDPTTGLSQEAVQEGKVKVLEVLTPDQASRMATKNDMAYALARKNIGAGVNPRSKKRGRRK